MVVIRLSRGGAKKRPFYHIVVADKRDARDGRNVERLGYFNPISKGNSIRVHIELDRLSYWLAQGAQPSERVANIIKEAKAGPEAYAANLKKRAEKRAKRKAATKAAASADATTAEASAA